MMNRYFFYNTTTCRYEPFYVRGKLLRTRIVIILISATVLAGSVFLANLDYIKEITGYQLLRKNAELKTKWQHLSKRIETSQNQLNELIQKDDNNYRLILDSPPLEASFRSGGIGGRNKTDFESIKEYPAIMDIYKKAIKLRYQSEIELQSYQEMEQILDRKLHSWAARPAIQPINNTELETLHLTYGARLHPKYHVMRDHKGLDFAAPTGTPVYASGDGIVTKVYYSDSYGKVVFVDHGFGFETRYAHLNDFAVNEGQRIKRGQQLGFVGNTGVSVAPHLHYEILINGEHVNPINFFQRNLSNQEYQKLIDHKSESTISLD